MMHQKVFLCSSIVLVLALISFTYAGEENGSHSTHTSTHHTTHHTTDHTTHHTTDHTTDHTTHHTTHHTTDHTTHKSTHHSTTGKKSTTYKYPYKYPNRGRYSQDGDNDYYDGVYGSSGRGSYDDDDDDDDNYGGYNQGGYGGSSRGRSRGNNGKYNNGYKVTGYDGIDPRKNGQDRADYGPIYDNQKSMLQSLDIWVSAADDWDIRSSSGYSGKKNMKGKYNKGKGYKNDDYNSKDKGYKGKDNDYKGKDDDYKSKDDDDYKGKDDDYKSKDNDYKSKDRKKRSYSRVRFPVQQYKDINRFPIRRFPPLLSIFPWIPIFYDKITYQTFIFSPTGGIYILPPLINFYGQRFAVAQLIKWGYASLVSSGAPPPPNVNVAPLVQPPPPAGGVVAAGVVGSPSTGPAPAFDSNKGRFTGGVKTDFPNFKPQYSKNYNEDGPRNYGPSGKNNNGPDSNYGGTGKQDVYAQGPQRGGGGYNN